jgi:hypothetical protein
MRVKTLAVLGTASLLAVGLAAQTPLKPGEIPLPYPVVTTGAKAGDFVIAPSREFLDNAIAKGADKTTFIYYGATMVVPGPAESQIKTLVGKVVNMPNSLIVPIRKGEKAQVGDVLLGVWQSGSGMQRSIVIAGGAPEAPKVRYLDIDYENPAGVGKKDDALKPDTFQKQSDGLIVGNVAAVKKGTSFERGIVVNVAGDKVLLLGFAGRLSVAPKADCVPIPIKPKVKKGDKVLVPVFTAFKPAVVDSVDEAIGRVFVTYDFGGKPQQKAIAFGDVATKLP